MRVTDFTKALIDQALVDTLLGVSRSLQDIIKDWQSLTPLQRSRIKGMGEKSYIRCKKIMKLLDKNPSIAANNLDVAELKQSFNFYEQLVSIRESINQFNIIFKDVMLEFGADLKKDCYDTYSISKRSGKNLGLDELMDSIEKDFAIKNPPKPRLTAAQKEQAKKDKEAKEAKEAAEKEKQAEQEKQQAQVEPTKQVMQEAPVVNKGSEEPKK